MPSYLAHAEERVYFSTKSFLVLFYLCRQQQRRIAVKLCYNIETRMNNSTGSESCSQVVSILFITITSFISLAAFIGNFLVTVLFLKTPSLKTSTNCYIVNMAISDMLSSCFNWLLYTTEGMLTRRVFITEPSASILCKLGMYSRGVSQVVSVLSLVLISVERYFAIVFPLKITMLDQVLVRLSLSFLTWIIPVVFGCPFILFPEIIPVDDHTFCRLLWNGSGYTTYNIFGFVLFYCIPFIVIIVLCARIVKALRQRSKLVDVMRGPVINTRQKQHQNIMKILISIVVAFFVCWTPLGIYLALKMFYSDRFVEDQCQTISALFYYFLPCLSSAVNPVILLLFSTNYRQALVNLCPRLRDCLERYIFRKSSSNNRIGPSHASTLRMIDLN